VYTAAFGEVQVSLTLPAPDDATVRAIKALTSKVEDLKPSKQFPMTVAAFKVTNGSSGPTRCINYSFSLTFNSGNQVDSRQGYEYLGDLQEVIPISEETALYSEDVDLYNQLLEPTDIVPGASRTSHCVFKVDELAGLTKVSVSHYGQTQEMKEQ
jgi:hypothetical protein